MLFLFSRSYADDNKDLSIYLDQCEDSNNKITSFYYSGGYVSPIYFCVEFLQNQKIISQNEQIIRLLSKK